MKQIERLGRLVEDTVRLIKDGGIDPTEALLRTARSEGMTESDVDFVAGQVNKAGHLVHMVKSAGADRLADFPLADAAAVKSRLDNGVKSPELSPKSESILGDALKGVVDKKVVVKKASAADAPKKRRPESHRRLTDTERDDIRIQNGVDLGRELGRANLHCSEAERRLEVVLRRDMATIYGDLGESIASIADRVSKQAAAEQTRYARRIISRYGSAARPLLDCVWHCARMEGLIPEGKSNTAMFPATRLYMDTSDAVDSAARMGVVRDNVDYLAKRADGLGEDFFANLGANIATGMLPGSSKTRAGMEVANSYRDRDANKDFINPELSLQTQARIKGLRTRKVFMDTVLNDANLRGNSLRNLTSAFNDTIQMDPDIVHRPAMLRAGMMQFLSSNIPDIFTLSAISGAGEKSAKQRAAGIDRQTSLSDANKSMGDEFATGVSERQTDVGKQRGENIQADEARRARAAARRVSAVVRLGAGVKGAGAATGKMATGAAGLAQAVKSRTDRKRMISQAVNELDKSGDLGTALQAGGFKDRKAFEKELYDRASGKSVAKEMKTHMNALDLGDVKLDPVERVVDSIKQRMAAETADASATRDREATSVKAEDLLGRAVRDAVREQRPAGVDVTTYDRALDALATASGVDIQDLMDRVPASPGNGEAEGTLRNLADQAGKISLKMTDIEKLSATENLDLPLDAYLRALTSNTAGGELDPADVVEVRRGQGALRSRTLNETVRGLLDMRPSDMQTQDAAMEIAVGDVYKDLGWLSTPSGSPLDALSKALALGALPGSAYKDQIDAFDRDHGAPPSIFVEKVREQLKSDPEVLSQFEDLRARSRSLALASLRKHPILTEMF